MKLVKGDKVIVISGKDKGKIGNIQKALPKEHKVIVDGVNVRKKHIKPTQSATNLIKTVKRLELSKLTEKKLNRGDRYGRNKENYSYSKKDNKNC